MGVGGKEHTEVRVRYIATLSYPIAVLRPSHRSGSAFAAPSSRRTTIFAPY
jgi:hypothetical protein